VTSIEKSTPPIGAPKVDETPTAQPMASSCSRSGFEWRRRSKQPSERSHSTTQHLDGMVRRGENGVLGGVWLEGNGISEGAEVMGRFSRVRRAAARLQMQPDELPVASYGLTKTATLTVPRARDVHKRPLLAERQVGA